MNNQNISNDELLEELIERVKKGEIKSSSIYHCETDKIVIRFETDNSINDFTSKLDIEKQFRYYKNYENFCLPLVEEKQKREFNQKLEKIKINHDI